MSIPALSQTIGITGNIGSGKSAVCSYLRQKGFYCLDADEVVRKLKAPGERAYQEIIEVFGKEILDNDNQINNHKLGKLVFTDKDKRETLENIIHPKIWPMSCQLAKNALETNDTPKTWFYEAALLIENNLESRFSQLWFVSCPVDTRRQRVAKSRGVSPQKFDSINQTQMPEPQKSKKATHTIQNKRNVHLLINQNVVASNEAQKTKETIDANQVFEAVTKDEKPQPKTLSGTPQKMP